MKDYLSQIRELYKEFWKDFGYLEDNQTLPSNEIKYLKKRWNYTGYHHEN